MVKTTPGSGSASHADQHRAVPVVRMANDIARQFGHLTRRDAAAAFSRHVRMFWDPRMQANLEHEVERDPANLNPIVVSAVEADRCKDRRR